MSCRDLDGSVTVQEPEDDLTKRGRQQRERRVADSFGQLEVLGIEIGSDPGVGSFDEGSGDVTLLVAAPFPKRRAEQVPSDGGDVPVC
jgi:hypothetical protein